MKIKAKKLSFFILCTVFAVSFTGCEKYLEVSSETQKQVGQSFHSIADLRAATAFLYSAPWNKFNTHARTITEGRANNVYIDGVTGNLAAYALFAENSNFAELYQVWGVMYVVISQADYIINDYVPQAIANGVDENQAKACEGEARFMRALAYWYAAMLWHDVPIINDPRDKVLNTIIPPNQFEDVIQYAINDLEIASETMLATDDKGRVTKYGAKALLARLYLTAADYAMGNRFSAEYLSRNESGSNAELAEKYFNRAKVLTASVIDESPYEILADYEDLFKTQKNNNEELLFGIQFIPGLTDYGYQNSLNSLSYDKTVTDNLSGSSTQFVSYDLLRMYVNDKALSRLRGNVCVPGQNYAYLGTHLPAGSWTVPSGRTKCNLKKFVVGSTKDTDGAAVVGNTGLVTPMIRMAEVYLMYAEAAMGSATETSDSKALEYFNKVRKRAFLLNPTDFTAYTTLTRNDLFKERRLEFFYEALYWPDLVRRSFYDMDWVLDFLNNKLKDSDPLTDFTNYASFSYTFDPVKYPATKGWDNSPRQQAGYISQRVVHNVPAGSYVHAIDAKSNIWALPYPAAEVSSDPELNSAPVKYEFK